MRCPALPFLPIFRTVRRGGFVLACLLLLAAGCASKTIIQSAPQVPSPPPAMPSAVSDALRAQYESWKGVPHRIGGSDRRGVDCSGLMQAVFRDAFRIELPRTSRDQSRLGQRVDVWAMRPGDLVYFSDKGGDHIGVVVDNRTFLHASSTMGVTLSEFDAYWWPRLRRVQRILS